MSTEKTYFQTWYANPENKEKRKQRYQANKAQTHEAYMKKRYDDAGKPRPVKKIVKTEEDIKHEEIVALVSRLKKLMPELAVSGMNPPGIGQN